MALSAPVATSSPRTPAPANPKPVPGAPDPPEIWLTTLSVVLMLMATAVGAFAVHLFLVSPILHARAQQVTYAEFRTALSEGTGPTGQLTREGEVHELGTPVGFLTNEDLGLERELILEGTTGQVLTRGLGHRRSTVLPGQPGVSVVYGRAWSYGGPFGDLGRIPLGSEIVVTTGQGEHTYRVTGLRRPGDILPPVPDVAAGEGRLTLVSAEGTPYVGGSVLYVDADLTSPSVAAPGLVFSSAALPPSEEAYGTEPAAWVPLSLYMLAIAAASLATAYCVVQWGARQAWLVGFPTILLMTTLASGELMRLLPNLL